MLSLLIFYVTLLTYSSSSIVPVERKGKIRVLVIEIEDFRTELFLFLPVTLQELCSCSVIRPHPALLA